MRADLRSPALLFRIESIWVLLPLVFVFWITAATPMTMDTWWTIGVGRLLTQTRELPNTYPFTFPEQAFRFRDTQWLAQLIYFSPYPFSGLEGIVVLDALIVTATFGFVLHLGWSHSHNLRAASICTLLAGLIASTNLQPRAQTLGFLWFAMTCWLAKPPLDDSSRVPQARRRLASILLIEILWANTHGSFFLGPLFVLVLATGHLIDVTTRAGWQAALRDRLTLFLIVAGTLQAAATLVTPFGVDLFAYVFQVSINPVVRASVVEWQPAPWDSTSGAILLASIGATIALLAFSYRRIKVADILILLIFGILAMQAVRNVAWWGLVAGPILAVYLGGLFPALAILRQPPSRLARSANSLVIGVILVVGATALPWLKDANPLLLSDFRGVISQDAPSMAAVYLSEQASCGRVFSLQQWSGFLNWRLWPHCSTMVDAPIEVFAPQVWDDYWSITTGVSSSEDLLNQYQVDLAVLSKPQQQTLVGRLAGSAEWTRVYEDELAEIFGRRTPSTMH